MKAKLYIIGLMLGALSLSNCTKDEATDTTLPGKEITQVFLSEDPELPEGIAADSRTTVNDDGTISFIASEKMSSHCWAIVNGNVVKSTDGKTATRTAGIPSTISAPYTEIANATDYNFVFVSPAGNGKIENDKTYTALTVSLGATQVPVAATTTANASFDANQDVLVSKKTTVTPSSTPASMQTVLFKRLFTFFKLSIDRSVITQIPEGDKIISVTITANDPTVTLAGNATVPIVDDPALCIPTFTTSSNSVTADYGTGAEFLNDRFDAWLIVNPATFTGMQIQIRTTHKIITQTLNSFLCQLRANAINTISFQVVNTASVTTTISDSEDYYLTGVTIDGTTYSGTTAGAQLLNTGAAITPANGGVLFLGTSATTPSSAPAITKDLTIIGRYSDQPTSLPVNTYWALRNVGGKAIFKNLDLDFAAISNAYCFNLTGTSGGLGTLYFENCTLRVPSQKTLLTLNGAPSAQCLERIIFRNCKIIIEAPTGGYYLINLDNIGTGNTDITNLKEIRFENNLIYSKSADMNSSLVSMSGNITSNRAGTPNLDIVFSNNTLVDIGYYQGLFKMGNSLKSITAEKNILYNSTKDTAIIGMSLDYATVSSATAPLQTGDNLTFGKKWRLNSTSNASITQPANNELTNASPAPLSTCDTQQGIFIKDPSAADYGSSLE